MAPQSRRRQTNCHRLNPQAPTVALQERQTHQLNLNQKRKQHTYAAPIDRSDRLQRLVLDGKIDECADDQGVLDSSMQEQSIDAF